MLSIAGMPLSLRLNHCSLDRPCDLPMKPAARLPSSPPIPPVTMMGSSGWKHTAAMLCEWPSSVCSNGEQDGCQFSRGCQFPHGGSIPTSFCFACPSLTQQAEWERLSTACSKEAWVHACCLWKWWLSVFRFTCYSHIFPPTHTSIWIACCMS